MSKFRVVIRFSVDKENNGKLRNKLVAVLRKFGVLLQKATATYENQSARVEEGDLSNMLEEFWGTASGHDGVGKVDHFWMYTDRKGKRSAVKKAVKKAAKKLPSKGHNSKG